VRGKSSRSSLGGCNRWEGRAVVQEEDDIEDCKRRGLTVSTLAVPAQPSCLPATLHSASLQVCLSKPLTIGAAGAESCGWLQLQGFRSRAVEGRAEPMSLCCLHRWAWTWCKARPNDYALEMYGLPSSH
jgi:hypothetical protein